MVERRSKDRATGKWLYNRVLTLPNARAEGTGKLPLTKGVPYLQAEQKEHARRAGKGFAQRQGKRVAAQRQGVSPESLRVSGERGKTSHKIKLKEKIMINLTITEEEQKIIFAALNIYRIDHALYLMQEYPKNNITESNLLKKLDNLIEKLYYKISIDK